MITLKKKFSDLNNFIFNKTVIVRVDLNLPTHDDKFIDITRLEKIKPTIDFLLKNQAKILLISHFGRPQGDKNIEFLMKNLIPEINKVLGKEIFFLAESLKNLKKDKINKFFEKNKIILLENLRFYPEEEKNDETFSKKLASFGDIYVNECFSVSHRSHSSIIGIPKFLPSFPGMLLELEIYNLKNLITSNNLSSSVALFGGSKISTKLKIIEFYLKKFGKVIIGGAMAHTFLKAMGNQIGSSIYEKSMLKTSEKLLAEYPEKFSLPVDAIVMNKKNTVPAVRGIEEIEKQFKENINLNEEIIQYIATESKTNIRELIGVLNRIIAFSRVHNKNLAINDCKNILKDVFSQIRVITVDKIQNVVSNYFNIALSEMLSQRRSRPLARPRQIAMYLAKKMTTRSLPEIGRRFANRDHTTVIHAVKTITRLSEQDDEMKKNINQIKSLLLEQ